MEELTVAEIEMAKEAVAARIRDDMNHGRQGSATAHQKVWNKLCEMGYETAKKTA